MALQYEGFTLRGPVFCLSAVMHKSDYMSLIVPEK
jgi:hypothetical protein